MQVENKFAGKKVGKFIKYFVLGTNIIAILFLLLSILAWEILPSKVTFIAYLGLGFPFILCANIGYLLLWVIFLRWRYVIVQLIIILACWYPISATFPINFRTKELPEKNFKILSYNVRSFNWLTGDKARKNPIFDYVINSNADIVCFQEFAALKSSKGRTSIITKNELDKIMKDYPYNSVIHLGRSRGQVIYGLACYSKYPILKAKQIPIESTYNGSVIYEIEIDGKVVTLVNNHLESNRLTAEDKKLYKDFLKTRDRESFDEMANALQERLGVAYKTREQQANTIRKIIDEQKTDATIVCGDFNDAPISYAYHTIKGNLVDSYVNTGFGYGMTYHENFFWVRIDYIMHSGNMQSYNCTVDKIKYSDHYPIWTNLAFK